MENEETAIEEAQVVETALRPVFSNDPEQAMQKAESLIRAISARCKGKKFIAKIKGEDYPRVEWWTTTGAQLSLSPYIVPDSVQAIMKNDQVWGFRARAEVRDIRFNPPKVITSAEAICTRDESLWKSRDEHALSSMSQTRAVSKAYRLGLSWLAVMAGLQPTGAEEMPGYSGNGKKKATKEVSAKKLTQKNLDLKKRLSNWLDAVANGDPEALQITISSLTNKLYTSLDQITDPAHIKRLFEKCKIEIEEFENVGSAGGA